MPAEIPSSVAMPAAIPEEQRQSLVDIIKNDPDVKESRTPQTTILKAGDLTTDEKMHLIDLLGIFIKNHRYLRLLDDAQIYHKFLDALFEFWDSNDLPDSTIFLRPLRPSDIRVQVGVLRNNHPEPNTHHEGDLPLTRLAGAPVFLRVIYEPELSSLRWFWGDENDKAVKLECIEFDAGLTEVEAKAQAVIKHDKIERGRITAYNRDLVLNAARSRISKWARDGTGITVTVDECDCLGEDDVEELYLAREHLRDIIRLDALLESGPGHNA